MHQNMSKSQSKLQVAAKRDQHRRFGEYHGEDGLEYEPANTQSIWNQSACKYHLMNASTLLLSLTFLIADSLTDCLIEW